MVTVLIVIVLAVPLDHIADDPFQEGEYAIWMTARQAAPDAPRPVLIHGGLDIVPPWLAAMTCPADRQLACVRLVNAVLELAAGGLFVALLAVLAGLGSAAAVAATFPAMLAFGLLGGSASSPLEAQHGTPGVRELALEAGLVVVALLARDGGRRRPGLFVALGAITAVAPLWSYNRGLVLVLVGGGFTLLACLVRRSVWPATLTAAGMLAATGAMVAFGWGPAIIAAGYDIEYWRRNAAIWDSPLDPFDALAVAAVHLTALAFAGPPAWSEWRSGRPGTALIALPLAMTSALVLIQAAGRPDAEHLRWTLWPSLLLLAVGLKVRLQGEPARSAVTLSGVAAVVATLSALLISYRWPAQWTTGPGLAANIRLLRNGLPTDGDLAGPDMVHSARIVRADGGCTFAANNAGLVHLLAGVPPCSRFWFGVYIGPEQQQAVIAELEAARPHFILWDAPMWWAHIDGRSFAQRTPLLAAWIVANYPVEIRAGKQVLRTRADK